MERVFSTFSMNNCRISFALLGLLVSALALLTILGSSRGGTSSSLDLVASSRPVLVSPSESPLPLFTRNDSLLQPVRMTRRQHCSGLEHIPFEACRFSDVRRTRAPHSEVVANESQLTFDNDESRWSRITCPSKGSPYRIIPEDNTGRDSEIHTSKVVSKYTTYAARCAANHGIMWARMSSGMHRRIMRRTVGLLLNLIIPSSSDTSSTTPSPLASSHSRPSLSNTKASSFSSQHHNDELVKPRQQSNVVPRLLLNGTHRQLHVLDFGSGCGVTLPTLETVLAEFIAFHGRDVVEQSLGFLLPEKPPLVRGLGIDLIEAGIVYSNATYRSPSRLFCQADGSRLPWVPDRMFDWVVSFAAASHLPNAVRCSVVRMLLSEKLRPRGAMWLGYVPGNVACDFFCNHDEDSEVLWQQCRRNVATVHSAQKSADPSLIPQPAHNTSTPPSDTNGVVAIPSASEKRTAEVPTDEMMVTTISLLREQALWKGLRIHRYYQDGYSLVWKKMLLGH